MLRREVYIYQVRDNEESLERTGVGAVQSQTAFLPAMVLELIGSGRWEYAGVRCPELCDPHPVFSLMDEYGFGGALVEMDSEYKRARDAAALRAPLPQRTTSVHGGSDACISSGFTETRSEG